MGEVLAIDVVTDYHLLSQVIGPAGGVFMGALPPPDGFPQSLAGRAGVQANLNPATRVI